MSPLHVISLIWPKPLSANGGPWPLTLIKDRQLQQTVYASHNNKNLSSQLGFLVVLAHENYLESSFALISNIMHWSFTKCKRIICSIFASKVYGIMNGINIGIVFVVTLKIIILQIN
jgi:hypothetical protein